MKRLLVLVPVLLIFTEVLSQQPVHCDSLQKKLRGDSLHIFRKTFIKPYLRFENRFTFLEGQGASMLGAMGGVTFNNRHTACVGYFFLRKETNPVQYIAGNTNQRNFVSLDYFVISYIYVAATSRYFQVNLPVEAGYGDYRLKITDENKVEINQYSGRIIPVAGGVQLIGKVTRWIGVWALGGFRVANTNEIDQSFNGWYYTFGLWLDVRQLARTLKYQQAKRKCEKLCGQM